MPLTSVHLALLSEIGRTGSLARAALSLDVTPPAVSQQLARIEKEIGVPLVERGARGARLTVLGQRLAGHGAVVADELARAGDAAAEFIGAHTNRLRVGAPPSLAVGLMPSVLTTIRYQFPTAELTVVDTMSDAGFDLVAGGTLDVALTATYGGHPMGAAGVTLYHLLHDPLVVVLPDDHRLAACPRGSCVELSELASESWASGPRGRPSRTQLDEAAAEAGFIPRVPFQTESYDVAQALAGAGVAVALIPRLALNDLPTTTTRSLTSRIMRQVYAVLPSSDDHVPLAREFLVRMQQVVSGSES